GLSARFEIQCGNRPPRKPSAPCGPATALRANHWTIYSIPPALETSSLPSPRPFSESSFPAPSLKRQAPSQPPRQAGSALSDSSLNAYSLHRFWQDYPEDTPPRNPPVTDVFGRNKFPISSGFYLDC